MCLAKSNGYMKFDSRLLHKIFCLVSFLYFVNGLAELQEKNDKDPNKKNWYEYNITVPLFISRFEGNWSWFISFVLLNIGLIIFALLPFAYIDGFQSCLISSMGTFFFVTHILARPLAIIPGPIDLIVWILAYFVAVVAGIFSVNEKFSNLFLSIGGGYITSSFLVALLSFKHYLIYVLTFVIFFVGFVMFKKIKAELHYCVVKSLVLSFAITILVDLMTPIKMFKALYGESGRVSAAHKYIGYALFFAEIFMIFTYTYFRTSLQNLINSKK